MKKMSRVLVLLLAMALLMTGAVLYAFAADGAAEASLDAPWQYVDSSGATKTAATLNDAVAAAKAGTTVTLLCDTTEVTSKDVGVTATFSKALTVDLGGYTYRVSQSGQHPIAIKTTAGVTIKNGTVVASGNSSYSSTVGNAYSFIRLDVGNSVVNIENVNTYVGSLVLAGWQNDVTINVTGGAHHVIFQHTNVFGGLVETRRNATVNITDAFVYVDKGEFIGSCIYNETAATKYSNYTVKNSTVIASDGAKSLIAYANEYTTVTFDGCTLYGSINPVHRSEDINKGYAAMKDGAITAKGNTVIGGGADQVIKESLLSAEGYNLIKNNECSFVLSKGNMFFDTSSGTVADVSFAIDTKPTEIKFLTYQAYGDVSEFNFVYDFGGTEYYTTSLSYALANSDGCVRSLKTTNIDISGEEYCLIERKVTLDLGGAALKLRDDNSNSLRLGDGASVTVKNGTLIKRGKSLSNPVAPLFSVEGDGVTISFENADVFTGALISNAGEGLTVLAKDSTFNGINGSVSEPNSLICSTASLTLSAEGSSFVADADTTVLSVSASSESNVYFKDCKVANIGAADIVKYANDNLKITFDGGYVYGTVAPTLKEGDASPAMSRGSVTVTAGTYVSDVSSNTAGLVSVPSGSVFNSVTKSDKIEYVSSAGAARGTQLNYVWQIGAPDSSATVTYTSGALVVASDDLKGAIGLVDEGGTVTLLKSVTLTESTKGFVTISKPMTLDLGGKTLTLIQEGEANFYVSADLTIRNGSLRAAMNDSAPYPGRSYPMFCYGISKKNITVDLENVNTYGGSFFYTYNGTGHALNVTGGEHYAFNPGTGCDNGWLDVRCDFDFNATDALFVSGDSSWIVSSLAFKDTDNSDLRADFNFTNCKILTETGKSAVIGYANENSFFNFDGCNIYGAINPSLNSNDSNASYGAIGAGNITLGEGTRLNGAATLIGGGVITAESGFVLLNRAYTETVNVKSVSFDSATGKFTVSTKTVTATYTKRVIDENNTDITVTFYSQDGKTVISSVKVQEGTVVTPPEYTSTKSNGWFSASFSGWSTERFGTTPVTDFTARADVCYYPTYTGEITPDFTAASYNLAFIGKVRNNIYIPTPPEGIKLLGVWDVNGNKLSGVNVRMSDGKVYKMYNIGEVGATEIAHNTVVTVKYTFGGVEYSDELSVSPLRYAMAIMNDADSGEGVFSESVYKLVSDLVVYSNTLTKAVSGSDNADLADALARVEAYRSSLPAENEFAARLANTAAFVGTLSSIQLEVSSTEPRWIINIASGVSVESITLSLEGYLPTVEDGVNFGSITYATYPNASGTGFYTESIPMYNLDRLMTITVKLTDGTEVVGTYDLNAYYNGFSATGESAARVKEFLKTFRAFSRSSSGYKYGEEIVREGNVKEFFACEHTDMRAYQEGVGRFCYGCETYLFFYSDFGAVADGVSDRAGTASGTNDFDAIYACHAAANAWRARGNKSAVVAVGGSHSRTDYYIGAPTALESIPIQTDVQWSGANLIIDDRAVSQTVGDHYLPVFTATRGRESALKDISATYTASISKGATNIGYAPGQPSLIYITDRSIKRYIREGANADGGSYQGEVIVVDEYGNVSPTTPIEWDYPNTTYCQYGCATVDADGNGKCDTCSNSITNSLLFKVYGIAETPITISGLDRNGEINFTWENVTSSTVNVLKYDQCGRTIKIERSNVTVQGIDHLFTEDNDNTTPRQAYAGIVNVGNCHNVVIKDMLVYQHLGHYTQDANGKNTSVSLGSYEFSTAACSSVSWINCQVKNFFWSDGTITYRGLFGTNGLRNAYLKNCFLNSFDSHSALYNATIEDSTFDHINFIGAGDVTLKNVTIYTSSAYKMGIHLRQDYGATWNGNFYIDGFDIRYSSAYTGISYIDLIRGYYTNWYFGYDTYLPIEIHASNITLSKYTRTSPECEFVNGTLVENIVGVNEVPLAIYGLLNTALKNDYDYSSVNANNADPKHCTEAIYFSNNGNLTYKYPDHPFFENMKVYIDGVEKTNWYSKRSSIKCTDTDGDKVCNTCFKALSCSASHPTSGNTTATCSTCGATVSATSSSSGECITGDTLITLADGSRVRVDALRGDELLLVFDHYTGEYVASPIVVMENDGVADYEVVTLTFSDGTVTRLIDEHGYFDLTLGKYVYLDALCAESYLGHEFAKATAGGYAAVTLTDVSVGTSEEGCYSLVSAYHYNFIVDGMLSMPGGIDGIFNIFEYGDGLKYDEAQIAADIAEYGLYTYSDFADYVAEEVYEIFLATYYKVAVGKGMITLEQIYAYIAKYL